MKTERVQVLIIGAGISGSSTAIRLLQAGIQPLMIDQVDFPRDTVGEGLSPAITQYVAELGILDEINSPVFVKKTSFQFVSPSGDKGYTAIDLTKEPYLNGKHAYPWGFNVHRYRFDMVFQEKAKAMGADVRLRLGARQVLTDSEGRLTGVVAVDAAGRETRIESQLILDCSGRSSVVARQLGLRGPLEHVFDGQWANFAIRLHFSGLNMKPLTRDNPRYDPATVNIFPGNDCWYWFIPIRLDPELVSIGFVARGKMHRLFEGFTDKAEAYRDLIARHPVLKEIIAGARLDDNIVTTSRLGHMNARMSGPGYICVGDAAFFADPAWGTGVTISLATSKMAAATAVAAVAERDFSADFLARYDSAFRDFINDPFNSIRAFNAYYNDSDYINFITRRLGENQRDMDMLGAVIFDFISHQEFQRWTFREFKAYLAATGKVPIMERMSQLDFDSGRFADGTPAMATRPAKAAAEIGR